MTPLVPLDFSGMEILCKLDFLFPTGSFKDRGATVLMSKIKEWGLKQVLMDSSGNAAAATAAYAARAGIECDVYAPASTSAAKCAQITAYGANLHKNTRPTVRLHRPSPWKRRKSASTPLISGTPGSTTEPRPGRSRYGNNSASQRQTPSSRLRDTARPSSARTWAFSELLRAGYIDELPKIFAAQAVRCAPMVRMWEENLGGRPRDHAQRTLSRKAYPSPRPCAGSRCARPPLRAGGASSR